MSDPFHPDLRHVRFVPRAAVGPRTLPLVRALTTVMVRGSRAAEVVPLEPGVSVRVFWPATAQPKAPALLWVHGGGFVMGTARQDDAACLRFAQQLGIVVASVEYRLAPEHPFPTPLYDCYTALRWLAGRPDVDPERIAIGGASAGGGLAAALALLARERGEVRPVLQLLSYPMLDDRTTLRTDVDPQRLRLWSVANNRFGWRSYLGPAAGDVPPLAAPARYADRARQRAHPVAGPVAHEMNVTCLAPPAKGRDVHLVRHDMPPQRRSPSFCRCHFSTSGGISASRNS